MFNQSNPCKAWGGHVPDYMGLPDWPLAGIPDRLTPAITGVVPLLIRINLFLPCKKGTIGLVTVHMTVSPDWHVITWLIT